MEVEKSGFIPFIYRVIAAFERGVGGGQECWNLSMIQYFLHGEFMGTERVSNLACILHIR
jgi:hypothetical protein